MEVIGYHVTILLPYIGSLPLRDVCNDSMESFKEERAADGAKNATVNRSLEVVRTVLNRAAPRLATAAARGWCFGGRPSIVARTCRK